MYDAVFSGVFSDFKNYLKASYASINAGKSSLVFVAFTHNDKILFLKAACLSEKFHDVGRTLSFECLVKNKHTQACWQ